MENRVYTSYTLAFDGASAEDLRSNDMIKRY